MMKVLYFQACEHKFFLFHSFEAKKSTLTVLSEAKFS